MRRLLITQQYTTSQPNRDAVIQAHLRIAIAAELKEDSLAKAIGCCEAILDVVNTPYVTVLALHACVQQIANLHVQMFMCA
jgi:hypothetical protein